MPATHSKKKPATTKKVAKKVAAKAGGGRSRAATKKTAAKKKTAKRRTTKKKTTKKKAATKKTAKRKAAAQTGSGGKGSSKKTTATAIAQPGKSAFARAWGLADGRKSQAERERERSKALAEIGPPPERDQERFDRYRDNLFLFLSECFPETTGLKPMSLDHQRLSDRTQGAIHHGGNELNIVYRGFGKSTIAENAAIWATGYGHRSFFLTIGATDDAARITFNSIQSEIETNSHLLALFPELVHCVVALDNAPLRAKRQTVNGERTHIEWTSTRMVQPMIPGYSGSGSVIATAGMTANIRGIRYKRSDGVQLRPDFVLVDDPQSDTVARSPTACESVLETINGTILRLAGQHKTMACVVNGTPKRKHDVIDQLSNPAFYPAWRTHRAAMLKSFADRHNDLWLGEYADRRCAFHEGDDHGKRQAHEAADAFYLENREAMDAGAEASWEHAYNEKECSAIQHAYNILIDSTLDAFMAECQSEPTSKKTGLYHPSVTEVCERQSHLERGKAPVECEAITGFIDVHPTILYWDKWAFQADETSWMIDQGTHPEQPRHYFDHGALAIELADLYPGQDYESTVYAALAELVPRMFLEDHASEDGQVLRMRRLGIDANGEAKRPVMDYIRSSPYREMIVATYGAGIPMRNKPISATEEGRKRGVGPEWAWVKPKPGEPRAVRFDANYHKTNLLRALTLAAGSRGAAYLHRVEQLAHHRLTAEAYNAEDSAYVSIDGGREGYEFKLKPGWQNHRWDCAVGCRVIASVEGVNARPNVAKRKRVKLSDLQRKRRAAK